MPDTHNFDLVIIGSGPGGYVAAIRGAQLGLKTAVVEKEKNPGGTCLNVGCIPSKALLHSTEMYHFAAQEARKHGIEWENLSISIDRLMSRKTEKVERLRSGITHLMKANKVEVFHGLGQLNGPNRVQVCGEGKKTVLHGKHIIIATGSSTIELPCLLFDGKTVISSDQAIALDAVPGNLAVVGAGAIGLELGVVWSRLGSHVDVIECLPHIAPTFDPDISKIAERLFKQQGLHFHLKTQVTGIQKEKGKAILRAEKDGQLIEFEADKVLVAVGRKPYTEALGLETVGIQTDDKGRIPVDKHFKTSANGIYAIGDVIPGPMLAHKAQEEAVACVELIDGQAGHVNYDVIPNVIYTEPEMAMAGLTETAARAAGIEFQSGQFNFSGNGRAIATDATDGCVKVTACKKTDRILGVQTIGKSASELIAGAITHMEYGGSAEDLGRTIHAHPTLSESMKEAALAVGGNALHKT